jgi:hypothetical protein
MKLQGIQSSKGRHQAFERNQERQAPPVAAGMAGHTPAPHPDGSLACCGCGTTRYSPAAFAAHLAGKPITDAEGAVFTTGPSDSWLAQQEPERQRQLTENQMAEWRAAMVQAYYAQQRRAPRIAEGVGASITDT